MGSQVLIVGAGPAGLTLGAELARAGVSCRILERRPVPYEHSRAFGLQPRTLEILDMRGQAERFVARGLPSPRMSLGSEGRGMDMTRVDTTFPFMLIIPQVDTEELLEQWALESGVVIERSAEVVGLTQDATGVTLQVRRSDGVRAERAEYVVGCDGAHSTVRDLLGVRFKGSEYDFSAIIADVGLRHPPREQVFARHSERGMVAVMPFPNGMYRIMIQDDRRMQVPVSEPVTMEEITRSARDILGVDLGIADARWLSRFRSEQRLSDRYRVGRVPLAGDAAHVHTPAGGQGLNLGIQDAVNLGWKLAATVNGWAPMGLLNSYEEELRPLAARVLRETDQVFRFNTAHSPPLRAVRWAVKQALLIPALQTQVLRQLSGTTVRYAPRHGVRAHRLVGRRVPDVSLTRPDGRRARLFELLRPARFVLVDRSPAGRFAEAAAGWSDRVDAVHGTPDPGRPWPLAVLVRPDGHVAWATEQPDPAQLPAALRGWCGTGTAAARHAVPARAGVGA